MAQQRKAMIVLSGGQDSTTCAYWAKECGYELHGVTFDYGQRHKIELDAAAKVAKLVGMKSHEVIKLGDHILKSTSPLVSSNELEQYLDADSLPGEGVEKTFIPMRNQLFLTIATNRAIAEDCSILVTGVCQADYGGYPDCRQSFIRRLEAATNYGLFENVETLNFKIRTPLMYLTKAQSVNLATRLPGCYHALSYSHTAYDGQYPPLGHDHATLLREKGFRDADIPDPLLLRAVYNDGVMRMDELPDSDNYDNAHLKQWLGFLSQDAENNHV